MVAPLAEAVVEILGASVDVLNAASPRTRRWKIVRTVLLSLILAVFIGVPLALWVWLA